MKSFLSRTSEKPIGRRYWDEQGKRFHRSFFGAQSTMYYLKEEQRLLSDHFQGLNGKKVLKLDLWSEAQNTEILFWTAQQGADCYAIDIAESTAVRARHRSRELNVPIRIAVADIANLPFPDETFDYLYSMGTIEHSPHQGRVISEIMRVLKKNGSVLFSIFFNKENYEERGKLLKKKLEDFDIIDEFEIEGRENEYFVLARLTSSPEA